MSSAQWLVGRHVTPCEAPPLSGEREGGRSRERERGRETERKGEEQGGARWSGGEGEKRGASGGGIKGRVIKRSKVRKTLVGMNTMAPCTWSAAEAILTETLAAEAVREERRRHTQRRSTI